MALPARYLTPAIPGASCPPAANAVRVLLVDDDEDAYLMVRDLLRAASSDKHELTWAATYDEALPVLLASACDVCLVDYRLGLRSGLDLLAELNAKSCRAQVILLVGHDDRDVDMTATKAGAADYLIKGEVTAALLERSIRYAVERGRTLKALRDVGDLAQSLNLAKSSFLAAMSHEIRTPMNAILGMADMLWDSPLNPAQSQCVEVVRRAGSDLLLLINDILDLSKIDAGHLELENVGFDLEEVVDQAIKLTAVKTRAKGIVLLSNLPPDTTTCLKGDPTRLKQILVNLLGNAVKFTESGEVMLTTRNLPSGKSGEIEFVVSDTGIGIAADKLETIFDDFTQADSSVTRKYGGTGLGLGISRRIVESMGGHLTASSAPGKGSSFRFTVQFAPAPETTRKAHVELGDLHNRRVLVIDESRTNSLILQETLHAWGLNSDVFASVPEALAHLPKQMACEEAYSLLIIDNFMRGTGGFEAAARIRDIAPELPIVMLTFEAQPGDTARRVETGLAGYAIKPVARAQMLRLVCDALETRAGPGPDRAGTSNPEDRKLVRPATILVAEDSADNRLLVQMYLNGSPYRLTFEEDGEAAVARFAGSDFDLILMDVRMPVMDGLAATRAIRALERERGSAPVPILALTAKAGVQDIEKSVEAGCDAHLSKPISKLELLAAIEKYRRRQPTPAEPVSIEMPEGFEDIAPAYLLHRRREVSEMAGLLTARDFKGLSILGHNMQGTAQGFGFPDLARLGAALEQSANQMDRGALEGQLTELENYLDQVQLVAKK